MIYLFTQRGDENHALHQSFYQARKSSVNCVCSLITVTVAGSLSYLWIVSVQVYSHLYTQKTICLSNL